jgi:hypothetical protein
MPQYVLAFVVVVSVVGLLWAGSTSTAAFGGYNPAWDGSRDARLLADEDADVAVLRDTAGYEGLDANTSTAVVLSPSEPYSDESLSRLRAFVERGGTLVVASDFDTQANDVLAGVGAGSRVDGRVLRDERFHGASPALPIATNVSNGSYTTGVDRLALNYPSIVVPGGNASTVVASSAYGYLDVNGNEELDDDEELGSSPVVTTESVGDGTVVVVSDPSVFINTMLDKGDNAAFAGNVFATETVAFDYSHSAGLPPLATVVLVLRESALAQLAVGVALVVLAALAMGGRRPVERVRDRLGRPDPVSRAGVSEREVVAFVHDRHPDWDRERAERLAQSINLPSRNDGGER